MVLKITALIAGIGAFWVKAKAAYKAIAPLVEPFIKEVEEKAKDGTIDKKDRKELAMYLIEVAQAQGKLKKFGFFEKLIISKVVDVIAQKLPDFEFNKKPDNA